MMRPLTLTRAAGLNRLRSRFVNSSVRRYMTILHPPKFENEKLVS